MERIQEAIEKAKRQRRLGTQEVAKAHKTPLTTTPSTTSSIQYTNTPSIQLDRQTLLANKIIAGLLNQPEAALFKQLRTQILQSMREKQWRSLGIVSPTIGSGASVVSTNLAISFSLEVNQTVLLVDLDLQSPNIARLLGINNDYGIADVLNQTVELSKVLINPQYERLVLLPGTPVSSNTSEMLSSPAMGKLQNELTHRYTDRYVIYDLPPLLIDDDALAFLPNLDAVLLVIEDGGVTQQDLERTTKLLEGKPIIGSVINKVKA